MPDHTGVGPVALHFAVREDLNSSTQQIGQRASFINLPRGGLLVSRPTYIVTEQQEHRSTWTAVSRRGQLIAQSKSLTTARELFRSYAEEKERHRDRSHGRWCPW